MHSTAWILTNLYLRMWYVKSWNLVLLCEDHLMSKEINDYKNYNKIINKKYTVKMMHWYICHHWQLLNNIFVYNFCNLFHIIMTIPLEKCIFEEQRSVIRFLFSDSFKSDEIYFRIATWSKLNELWTYLQVVVARAWISNVQDA